MAESRNWVCVRLATYESQEEADFLLSVYQGPNGVLNNTTFALLAPDGEEALVRTGRGPSFLVGERGTDHESVSDEATARFAAELAEEFGEYRAKREVASLPQCADFRRSLNVAACDNQPLVILLASSKSKRAALEKKVAALCWSDEFVGRFQYAIVSDRDVLAGIDRVPSGDGIVIVEPNQFGTEGAVLARASSSASEESLGAAFDEALEQYARTPLERADHRRQGRRAGAEWETEIPVTDPGRRRRG